MAGVILDEAHFIKNNSHRTSHCLKLLGVSNDARAALIGPRQVYLLTGTPITNRPRDLFNLLPSPSSTATLTRTTMAGSQPEHRTSKN
jgi:SNF2 family DNA or RNA helicase